MVKTILYPTFVSRPLNNFRPRQVIAVRPLSDFGHRSVIPERPLSYLRNLLVTPERPLMDLQPRYVHHAEMILLHGSSVKLTQRKNATKVQLWSRLLDFWARYSLAAVILWIKKFLSA